MHLVPESELFENDFAVLALLLDDVDRVDIIPKRDKKIAVLFTTLLLIAPFRRYFRIKLKDYSCTERAMLT